VDLTAERALIDALVDAIAAGLVHSAHDCSDGGLAVALAECCIMNRELERGATVDLSAWSSLPVRSLLFGEAQGRIVITTTMPDTMLRVAGDHGVPARVIGQVGAAGAPLQITTGRSRIVAPLARLDEAYYEAIPRIMSRPATAASSSDQG
jgi:phosphoribosylformylglycinamidine synthase